MALSMYMFHHRRHRHYGLMLHEYTASKAEQDGAANLKARGSTGKGQRMSIIRSRFLEDVEPT